MHALDKPETSPVRINVKTVNTSKANVRRFLLIHSQTEFSRTTVPPESMGQLAQAVALRPARHGCAMAARAVPEILGSALQAAAPGPRSPRHERRTPSINCTNGRRQSAVARTQNSWRTQDARYRHLRTHCLTPPAQTPPPAEPDLEDIPAQPYRSHGVDRFLYRADHHDEGAVRIHCPGT